MVFFEGFKSMGSRGQTNYMAVFAIHNPTAQTLYYEGTPFPTYVIERKVGGEWQADSNLPHPEVLESIFPGKSYRFSIMVPNSTNHWRVALLSVCPSRAPILFRRYFPPRTIVVRGPELAPHQHRHQSGGGAENVLSLQTVR